MSFVFEDGLGVGLPGHVVPELLRSPVALFGSSLLGFLLEGLLSKPFDVGSIGWKERKPFQSIK